MESVSDFLKRKAKGETQREDPVRDFLRKKAGAEDAGAYTPGVGKSGRPGVVLTPQPSKEPETPAQTGRLRPGWSVEDVVEAAEKTSYQKAVESEDNTSRTHLSGRFGETKTSEDKTPSTHLSGRIDEDKPAVTKEDVLQASDNYDKARANSFGASMALGAALTVRGQNPLSDSMPDVQAWANSAIAKAQAAKAAEQDALAQFNTIAERYQEQERERKYDALRKNPEFAAKSKGDEETAREAAGKMGTSGIMAAYYQIYHRNDPVKTTEDLMTGLGASLLGGELNQAQQPNYTAGNDLSFIRDDEADTFFYLWNTQGPKAASTYLDSIRSDLNARRNTEQEKLTIQYAQEHPVKASAESVLQNQLSIAGVVDLTVQNLRRQFGDKTKPIDYNTPAQDFGKTTQRIRDTVGKSLEEKYPDATALDGAINLASFLYQTGMSMADSGVQLIMNRLGVPQPVTLSLMAGGAAQQAVYDAKRRGASDGQALLFGYASGIAEYAFEKMSLDNLVNNVVEKTGASIGTKLTEKWLSGLAQKVTAGIIDVGTQSLVEGSEELFTSLANTVSDIMINQDKAELFANIQHYINNGVDPQVASKMVIKDWVNGLIADTLGGLISGVGMGGTGTALRAVANYGSDVGQAAVAAVQATRQDLSERNTPAPVEAPAQAEAPVPVEAPASVSPLQAAVDKLTAGQQLSEKDAKAIMADLQAMQTLRDAGMPETLRPGAEGRAQVRRAVEQYAAQEAPQTAQETQEPQPADITPAEEAPRTEGLRLPTAQETLTPAPERVNLLAQNRTEVTNNGQTEAPAPAPEAGTVRNAPAAAEPAGRQSTRGDGGRGSGLGRFLLQSFRANYQGARAQQQQNRRANALRTQAETRGDLTYFSGSEIAPDGTNEKLGAYAPEDMWDDELKQTVQEYADKGVTLTPILGQIGTKDGRARAYVSADGKQMWVQIDHSRLSWQQLAAHEELHRELKVNPGLREEIIRDLKSDPEIAKNYDKILRRYVEMYNKMGVTDAAKIEEEMLADYRAGFDMLKDTIGSGVIRAKAQESIRRTEARYESRAESSAAESQQEGKYSTDPSENRPTRVSLSGDESIEEENIRGGNAAVKRLIDEAKTVESPQELVARGAMRRTDLGPIDLVWGAPGTGKNFKRGYGLSHIIAKRNAENGNGEEVAYRLVEVIAKAKSGDIQRGSTPGNERTRLYYDGYTAVLSKTQGGNSWLLTGWENNESAAYAAGEGHNSSGATADAPTFTRRTGGNTADSKISIEEKDRSVNPSPEESVGIQVDTDSESAAPGNASLETWTASDYVQNREAAANDLAKRLDVSKKEALAYIDAVNSIAKIIANDRTRLDYVSSPGRSSFVGNAEYGGSIDFSTICKKRRLYTGTIEAIQKALPNKALTPDELLKIRSMMKDRGYEVSCGLCYVEGSRVKIGEYTQQFLDELKGTGLYVPTMAEMNTSDGQETLRAEHPEVYDEYVKFMNKLAQRKPKLFQMATEYKGEILQKFKDSKTVDSKNRNGGLRLQSYSDFEIIHLIDTMQVIMDMSRVGLAGQAYTKVPDFAWALGDTGLKINLSLIAKGVDANGRIILDEVEGMKRADAEALRDRYSKNVGTIIVTFTDAQLKAAMADPFIDFIIPFHRSQWSKAQYEAIGLPADAKDYTDQQNESYIEKVYSSSGKAQRPDNYMPNNYWDFSKTGKENAEMYLRMCAENNRRPKFYKLLVDNGDGSYSLQKDGSTDGYWKLLSDFKMYDNSGKGSPQTPVKPDFNMEQAERMLNDYTGGHQSFPVANDVVEDFLKGDTSLEMMPSESLVLRPPTERGRGRSTSPRKKVSRVRTHAFELGGLYNEVEAQMAENQPGEFTYDPVSEKRSMNEALGRLKKDFAGEAEKLASSDQWGGSDLDTAMGILYQYRQIGRETGDYSLFNDWSHVIQQKGTKGGQFVQAFAKYSRTATGVAQKAAENLRDQHALTPAQQKRVEGHVNELMRAVDDFAEEAARGSVEDARGAKKGLKLPSAKQQYGDTQKAKDAMNVVKEIYDIFSRKTRRDHGAPVEDWTKLTGDQLASRIASRFNSGNKQRTTMQTILDDLLTYASEHALPKRDGKTPRTATERITDYINNREAYGEAWSEAKQVLREMYANDQEKLDALEAFLNSTISYNGSDLDQTMFRAILESADALGLTKDDILKLTAAGVNEGTIDRITEEFLRRIGSDDANLRDTVARHITNLVMADNQEGRLGRMENEAAKELDLKLQNLLRESKQTKSSAANAIAQYLINDLGISGTDAAIAADHIASHYMERIESKAAQTLEKMFAEKGERVKPQQRDKLLDLIHLGGLTNANVEDAVVDALGIGKLSRAQQRQIMDAMAQFADTLDAIENDDLEGLRQLIRLQAAARGTKLSSLTEEILSGETDAEYLRNFATTQLGLIAADYDARSAGEKISTLQVISHLLNARTAMRNVTSNQVFDIVDSTANNVGLLPDLVMSKITGQRTVGLEKSWFSQAKRQGAMKGMGRNILEVALDVAPEDRNRSKYGTGGRRTFSMASSGTVGRILSKAEEIMGYELNTTDEFHKGSVYAETLESLGRFVDAGYMTEEEAAEFAAQEALYRSFQDDTKVGAMLAGLKDVLNIIGTGKTSGKTIRGLPVHDFGLGDLVVKYTQVPGALIHRAIEYSPVGYLKAIYNIAQLGNAKSRGESTIKQQRNAALALGRATTGSGLIMLFTLLAKLGLLRRGDDEKDKNAAALKNSQGLSGTQINLTALSRLLSGESAEPQQGDVLHDIGFLEPLDSLMTIAALINNDPEIKNLNLYEMFRSAETAKELGAKSLQGIWLALEDTSAMQTLSNIYSTIRYHDEENDLPLYMQIPMEIASSSVSGFIPAPIRQIAQATDTTYRDQYRSQDLLKQTGARVANAIPGLRKQLAPKITPLGEDKTYQEPWLNALNALVNPGNISVYQTDKARDELLRVYEETGEGSMLPARNAPYSINIGGESYTLTPDERTEYLRIRGQEETKFVESLLTANWYRNADADTKAAFLNSVKNIANDVAKSQWAAERGITYHDTTYRRYLKMLTEGTRYADVIKAANEDLADTVEAGIPRPVWDNAKAAFNDIANSDISSYEKGVQQRALISDLEDLDDQQKLLVYGDLSNADSREEQFRTVMDTGLSFNETAKIFDQYSAYKSEDETRASQDAKDFALWVDQRKDLTDEQKKVVKEQFKYWQMIPAEAERYEKYTDMGFAPEVASRIDSALSELQPLPGHDGVTDMQRTKAALGALGKNASKADQMKIVESFYGGSTTTKSGELSQWGKIKKVTSSGVTVDKTLKLIDDGSLDEYVNWMDWSKDVTPERKVDSNVYIKFQKTYNSTSSTYDETTGKAIKGQEKKDKVMAYIDGLNLTIDQKDGLYLTRYKESGLKDTPWHKGGGGSGKGKTYAPAKLRLPTTAERTAQTTTRLQLPSAPQARPTQQNKLRLK